MELISKLDTTVSNFINCQAKFLVNLEINDRNVWDEAVGSYLQPYFSDTEKNQITDVYDHYISQIKGKGDNLDVPEGTGKILCNVEFKLAYGGRILLNTTRFHVRRGRRYGLLGHNGCGKSTLMRAIATGQLAEFPGAEELMKLKACYVEHDIDGSNADTPTIDFCMQEPILAPLGREVVYKKLKDMGFTDDLINKPICNLSGGWKMKLALTRAMLIGADLLLLDEPTNHLDVDKVSWLVEFLSGKECENVTSLIVSHDSKFLDRVLTDVIHYENMKLKRYTGNLTQFVQQCPEAKAYFSIHDTALQFSFPKPGSLEGVKSRTKAIISLKNTTFSYPSASKPTIVGASVQCSQASRVACIGPNGAGKSTLIKLIVGELKPQEGEVIRHPNCRIAYVAQHAFHHIESHLDKSPIEYIQWRFSGGIDKEIEEMEESQVSDEERARYSQEFLVYTRQSAPELDEKGMKIRSGETTFENMEPYRKGEKLEAGVSHRSVSRLVGRRQVHGNYEYEVQWRGLDTDSNLFVPEKLLVKYGFEKMIKKVNDRIAAEGAATRPLTTAEVKNHLQDVGLEEDISRYGKLANLSGGQKVKVVIGAAMWFCPHLLILDEPTNYLDRDSLGALSKAIRDFEGGVLMISHNSEFYGDIAPEVWKVPGDGVVYTSGQEYIDIIKQKELQDKREASGKYHIIQEEDVYDSLGNKLQKKEEKVSVYTRQMLKDYQKKLKDLKKQMKDNPNLEDEIFDLEEKVRLASDYLAKNK